MGLKKKVVKKAINLTTKLLKLEIHHFGGKDAARISAMLAGELAPTVTQQTDIGRINFFCPGKIPVRRALSLLTKEPITIDWINTFNANAVLWDIGANVGVYSLYAAFRKLSVVSFEPSPSNYYLLNKNIEINKLDDRISALCIAFNDHTRLDAFYMANTKPGGSLNTFAEAVDWQGKYYEASFKQSMLGFSIDDFIKQFNPPFPNHIKIDVDGAENRIIKGAKKTLADNRVKSILVELDPKREDYYEEVISIIENSGMEYYKKEQVRPSKKSKFVSICNYIFIRPKP
jgi:FkbM family methyltransferase